MYIPLINLLRDLVKKHFDELKELIKEYSRYIGKDEKNRDLWSNGEKYFVQCLDKNEWCNAEDWQVKLINLKNITDLHYNRSLCYHNNKLYYYFNKSLSGYFISDITDTTDLNNIKMQQVKYCSLPEHSGPQTVDILNIKIDKNIINEIKNDNNDNIKDLTLFIQSDNRNEWYEGENWEKNILAKWKYEAQSKKIIDEDLSNVINKVIYKYNNNNYILILNYVNQHILNLVNLTTGVERQIIPCESFYSLTNDAITQNDYNYTIDEYIKDIDMSTVPRL
jgi:hypothetical protein